MSGAATIFGAGGGVLYGTTPEGNPQQILSDAQGVRVSLKPLGTMDTVVNGDNGAKILPAGDMKWNGTLFEPAENNRDMVLLASAARTASVSSPIVINRSAVGMIVYINVTASPANNDTLNPLVCVLDALDNLLVLWGAGAAHPAAQGVANDANGLYAYLFHSGAQNTVTGNTKVNLALPIPRRFFIEVDPSSPAPWTYSVCCSLMV